MKKIFQGLGIGLIALALVVGVGAGTADAALTLEALTITSDGTLTIGGQLQLTRLLLVHLLARRH